MENLKRIQRYTRIFIDTKRRRCTLLATEWDRWENDYLQRYFRLYAQKLLKEDNAHLQEKEAGAQKNPLVEHRLLSQAAKDKLKAEKETAKFMESLIGGGEDPIEWHDHKIPPEVRNHVISVFYMAKLRKLVQTTMNLWTVIRASAQVKKEIASFLQELGLGDASTKEIAFAPSDDFHQGHSDKEWWHLPRDTCLGLVTVCAQGLAHVAPFEDHPANKGDPDAVVAARQAMSAFAGSKWQEHLVRGLMPRLISVSVGRYARLTKNTEKWRQQLDEARGGLTTPTKGEKPAPSRVPSRMGRMGSHPTSSMSTIATGVASSRRRSIEVDVDDMFRSFTPRLREISESGGGSASAAASHDDAL